MARATTDYLRTLCSLSAEPVVDKYLYTGIEQPSLH